VCVCARVYMCVCVCVFARDKIVSHPRVSVCELEADAVAGDILNRHELSLGESPSRRSTSHVVPCVCIALEQLSLLGAYKHSQVPY